MLTTVSASATATLTATASALRMPILMFHRVGDLENASERRYCVAPAVFSAQMRALRDEGYRAVTLEDFLAWLSGTARVPSGSFLLTFDDGFRGVYEHAAPVLAGLGWPAVVFLVSGLVGGEDVWMRRTQPRARRQPLLCWSDIKAMRAAGFSFQSHSCTHADLPTLDDNALQRELRESRAVLEDAMGEPITCLAYPFGRYDDRVLAATRAAGYRAAFSTRSGFNRPLDPPFDLRRLDVFGTDSPKHLLRKLQLGSNDGSSIAMCRYYVGRLRTKLAGTGA